MLKDAAAVATWDAPPWADVRFVDEGAVEHCRRIGEIGPIEGEGPLVVEAVQRDEVHLALEPSSVSRTPAQVRLGGMRLSSSQSRSLAAQLIEAADMIDPEAN